MRGPGAFTGLDQSGFKNDPYFMLAARYGDLVEKTGESAKMLLNDRGRKDELEAAETVFNKFFRTGYDRFKTS